jgi:hypothetical protein
MELPMTATAKAIRRRRNAIPALSGPGRVSGDPCMSCILLYGKPSRMHH